MASPIVAGAAALIKAVNPRLRPNDVENILTNSADKYRELSTLIEDGNYLNLKDAVVLAQSYEPTPEPATEPEPYDGIIQSVRGKGKLKGTNDSDAFTFDSFESFTKKSADKIIGFDASQGDTIAVSSVAFPGLEGASEISFVSTKSKKELKLLSKQDYDFVYFEKKGRLYFDGNGSDKNWGDSEEGGLVAILKGKPELAADDFTFLA